MPASRRATRSVMVPGAVAPRASGTVSEPHPKPAGVHGAKAIAARAGAGAAAAAPSAASDARAARAARARIAATLAQEPRGEAR